MQEEGVLELFDRESVYTVAEVAAALRVSRATLLLPMLPSGGGWTEAVGPSRQNLEGDLAADPFRRTGQVGYHVFLE